MIAGALTLTVVLFILGYLMLCYLDDTWHTPPRWRIVETDKGYIPEYFMFGLEPAFKTTVPVYGWFPITYDKELVVLKLEGEFLAIHADMWRAKEVINKAKRLIEDHNNSIKEQKRKKKRYKHYV